MNKIVNILKKKKTIPLDKFINISLYDKNFGFYMKKVTRGEGTDPKPKKNKLFIITTY